MIPAISALKLCLPVGVSFCTTLKICAREFLAILESDIRPGTTALNLICGAMLCHGLYEPECSRFGRCINGVKTTIDCGY